MGKKTSYKINLDIPPNERWKEVATDYKKDIIEITNYVDIFLEPIGIIGCCVELYIGNIVNQLINQKKILYLDELESISNITGVSLTRIILMQLSYEANASCTSYMFKIKDIPIHFRTMDWGMHELNKMTIHLEFIKNNKTLFKATSFAGYVGIMTGMKPNLYSIALNFRIGGDSIWNNVNRAQKEYYPIGYLIREILCQDLDHEKFMSKLKTAKLIAPCYISGFFKQKAFRIIRSPEKTIYFREDDSLIQCNVDHYGDENNILYSNERIIVIKKLEKNIKTLDLDPKMIKKYFSIYPIKNELTIYTNVIFPTLGEMHTYVSK